jgi:beta-N-acetylhexosaminidase
MCSVPHSIRLPAIFLVFATGLGLVHSKTQQNKIVSERLSDEGQRWVRNTLTRLTLEEKIGQMLQVRFYADYDNFDGVEYKLVREQLQRYHVGSVVLGMHFAHSGPVRSSAGETATIANQLQHDSALPLLLAADVERGLASRLRDAPPFAWPMAFGAIGDVEDVKRFAAVTAQEARAVGIHWALAPVADVNSNPANPVINTRSFGEDPAQVSALVAAFIRSARINGMLVTAKHFPGNGDVTVDAHHNLATVDSTLQHLNSVEFPPFRSAIDAGVDAIMLAHARVPALDSDPSKIATVSPKIVSDTLKNQIGFNGLVVTDALEMRGLTDVYGTEKGSATARAAVDAVKAGCDVVMLPSDLDSAFHALVEAVHRGEISESRIDGSVRKILEMKAAVHLDKSRFVQVAAASKITSRPEDMEFAQRIADEAVTLVRDKTRLLPIPDSKRLLPSLTATQVTARTSTTLAVIIVGEALTDTDGREFERAIKDRRPDANVFYFDNRTAPSKLPEIFKAVEGANRVVLAVYVAHSAVRHMVADGKLLTSFGPLGQSGHLLERVLQSAAKKTAVIALGNPYLIVNYPETETYLCTYGQPSSSEISAVKALFGEIENHAKLPVTLPGIAVRGFSLSWPKQQVAMARSSR